MSWFPSLRVTPKIEQRESYWGLLPRFEPSAKVTKQPGKIGLFAGALTHLNRENDGPTVADLAETEAMRVKFRLIGTTERMATKAIRASGHQFVVKDRDGHPRGAFATVEEAEAKAGESDTIFDRLEGRNLNRKKRDADIPDPGVDEELPEQWTVGA
jgi:hypothetical protein